MVTSAAGTVQEYIANLQPDRRTAIEAVRRVILNHLPTGYEEGMEFGTITYYVPLSRLPDTYNGRPLCIAALASQKSYMSVYLMSVYGSPELKRRFEQDYRNAGKKLDMGKSCVRFKSLDDLPLDVIGKAIAAVGVDAYVAHYQASRAGTRRRPAAKARAKAKPAKPIKKAAAKATSKPRTKPRPRKRPKAKVSAKRA